MSATGSGPYPGAPQAFYTAPDTRGMSFRVGPHTVTTGTLNVAVSNDPGGNVGRRRNQSSPPVRNLFVVFLFCLAGANSWAEEFVATIPVVTRDARGDQVAADMIVTVFRPAGDGPFPAVILSHGRPGELQRAQMGRAKLSSVTTAFLMQGFVVAVPTRVGYGRTGGVDVEFSLSCEQPRYRETFSAAADQIAATSKYLRALPYVDPELLFLVGHSVGGAATVAAAVRDLPGVKAAVAFAAGQGARASSPGEPCGSSVLTNTFATYGATKSAVPQLWIHTENDRQFSAAHAREWFSTFQAAGGQGELRMFPAYREDGHWWFEREPSAWMPAVLQFFRAHGLRP
jgi:dienelactone hydrolase